MYADRVDGGTRRSVKERLDGNFSTGSTRQHRITGKSVQLSNCGIALAWTWEDALIGEIVGKYLARREDDKWKHDLYEDDEPQLSNRKVTAQDLRLKLQRKGLHPGGQTGKSSVHGERDLRERLSGTMTQQPKNYDPPKPKVAAKPSSKSIHVETPAVHINRSANPTPKKLSRKVCLGMVLHLTCLMQECFGYEVQMMQMCTLPSQRPTVKLFAAGSDPVMADASLDDFLQSLGLEKYLLSFQAEEVDMTALNHMTDEDLKAMGIPMGPRKKILLALESKG
ncbi:hypothetical protein JHK87_050339 [Glycine soja]|nr:hypothetical protein JHK87_050339 [Glycine soja]